MKKTKLVVFDMEGTIFKSRVNFKLNDREFVGGVWTLLCDILGDDASAANKKNYERFVNRHNPHYEGRYPGYFNFVEDTILIHKKYGLTKTQFYDVINTVPYFGGVGETFSKLQEHGIRIALISGGLKALAERVVMDYGLDSCFASAEYYWQGENLHRWNINPTDIDHKKTLVESLHRDLGIRRKQILFVGDGDNDKDIAEYCDAAIAFNPSGKELEHCCSVVITQEPGKEDLSEILNHIHW